MLESELGRVPKKIGRPEKIAAQLDAFSVPFGKYKGHLVRKIPDFDPGYAKWLVAQGWFKMRYPDEYLVLARAIDLRSSSVTAKPVDGGCIVYRPAIWCR
jgi:uncharacterized protein (DUF3820 family)